MRTNKCSSKGYIRLRNVYELKLRQHYKIYKNTIMLSISDYDQTKYKNTKLKNHCDLIYLY